MGLSHNQPDQTTGQEGLKLSDLAAAKDVLLRAPVRMALITFGVAGIFLAWNLGSEPAYRTTVKVRVEDISEKSPQLERRAIPAGVTTDGEALTVLKSRSLAEQVVRPRLPMSDESWRLGLTTWVTDEESSPLKRMVRRLIAEVSGDFSIQVQANRLTPEAPRSVRLRIVEDATAVEISDGGQAGSHGAVRVPFSPGTPIQYRDLELDIQTEGRPDGRPWLVECLTLEQAATRLLSRVRVDKQQYQPGTLGVTVIDSDGRRAAAIANAMAEAFVALDDQGTRARASEKVKYLNQELDGRRKRLAELEDRQGDLNRSNPDLVGGDATAAELAQREGIWEDRYRKARSERMAAQRVHRELVGGVDVDTALSGFTATLPTEIRALVDARTSDKARMRSVHRGSEDAGYRRTLLLKADDYRLEAQRFETRVEDLSQIIEDLEAGRVSALSRLGGDLAREGSVAVDRNVRLWIDELERASSEVEALRDEFEDHYPPLASQLELVEYYRSRILTGLRELRRGHEGSLRQKREYAEYWEKLHASFPDAEAALIAASVEQLDREIAAAFDSYAEGLVGEEAVAQIEHNRIVDRVQHLASARREVVRMEPERKQLEKVVGELMNDYENASIAVAGIESSARIVDHAVEPGAPFKPRAIFGLIAGLVLGLLASTMWSWLCLSEGGSSALSDAPAKGKKGRRSKKASTPEAESEPATPGWAPVPVFTAAPAVHAAPTSDDAPPPRIQPAAAQSPDDGSSAQGAAQPGSGSTLQVLARIPAWGTSTGSKRKQLFNGTERRDEGPWMPLFKDPEGSSADSVRALRARLRRATGRAETGAPILAVVSVAPGEGVAPVSLQLAASRAQLGERVLLVDAVGDLERLCTRAGLLPGSAESSASGGLLQLLDGSGEGRARSTKVDGLELLPLGSSTVPRADLFAGDTLRRTLDQARSHYSFVLLALPPVAAGPTAEYAVTAAHSTLLVRSETIPMPEEEREWALGLLREAGAQLAGQALTVAVDRRSARDADRRAG